MAERRTAGVPPFLVEESQPLIGVPVRQNGKEVVRYFADEEAADAAFSQRDVGEALNAFGAWSDLDYEETQRALDGIRHETP